MSDQPPQLRDQAGVRSGLRIGGGILVLVGLIFAIAGIADFFSSFNSTARGEASTPTHFWMVFIGFPMIAGGVWMLKVGFLGTATRYVVGEVAPTARDTIGYIAPAVKEAFGLGSQEAICAKCGGTNSADAKFCDHCGAALSNTCASCGHVNAADAEFCSECGKPLTA